MMKYAVVLTTMGRAKTELTRLRTRYGVYMKYSIEPHITVKFPFTLKTDINTFLTELGKMAVQTKPFTLILDGICYWEGSNNVAYVSVQNRLPVFNLHVAINSALKGLTMGDTTYDLQNFIPHLTISEHIPDDALPGIKRELIHYEPKYRVRMTSFTLFETKPNEKLEIWVHNRVFKFLE